MPKWILGVLVFLVLLFASVFLLAMLLLWLMLRKKEGGAPDVEGEYIDEGPYWEEEVPVLDVGAQGYAADDADVEAAIETEAVDLEDVVALAAAVAAANEAAEAAGVEEETGAGEPVQELGTPDAARDDAETRSGTEAGEPGTEAAKRGEDLAAGQTEAAALAAAAPVEPPEPDDLKRIEGIGPKIASVLQAAGITTFSQLAATDLGTIEDILEEESPQLLRLANPETWPEQADVAATGDWDALKELQDTLRAGRRRQ